MVGGQAPPPKYEDAIKYPGIQPPSYDTALEQQDEHEQQQQQQQSQEPSQGDNINGFIPPPIVVDGSSHTNAMNQDVNNNPVVFPPIDPGTVNEQNKWITVKI